MNIIKTIRTLFKTACPHTWKENPDYDDDWGGVWKAFECKRCELIKQVTLSGNVYYYKKEDFK